MLDILQYTENEIQKHQVSRNQYPGSINIADDFRRSSLSVVKYFM